jgi:hypothetical protein
MSGAAIVCFGIGIMICPVSPPTNTTKIVCPPLVGWSTADQKAAALELRKLPAGHPLRKMGVVTVKQRDLVRACERSE